MSDRVALFNQGRIEQVGSPAQVYEHPATAFVAGFVGVSNLLSGAAAAALTGTPHTFTVRPEKIRLYVNGDAPPDSHCRADGTIREVVYLGASTRYVVDLAAGGALIVVQQNLETASMDAISRRGENVTLGWHPAHNRMIEG
jgi:putative spermidine/putrescine transport system ATP-binding protein